MVGIHRREAKLGSHWDEFTKVYEGGITSRDAQLMALQYERKGYVDVADQAVRMIFEPNGRFSGSVEKVPSMNRAAKHSKLMMTEVIGVVRDEAIELRARPLWRMQHHSHYTRWAPAGLRRRVAAARGSGAREARVRAGWKVAEVLRKGISSLCQIDSLKSFRGLKVQLRPRVSRRCRCAWSRKAP